MLRRVALIFCLCLPALAQAQDQSPTASTDCTALAAQAGAAEGLPAGLLPAIALVESGHTDANGNHAPWPWTTNEGGKAHFFDSQTDALAYLENAVASGVTNIDVGCMQLNWKWHAAAFPSRDAMFDPVQNTRYAARFLRELHARLGSWEVATAAYHSTDPARGQDYLQKVAAAQGAQPLTAAGQTSALASAPIRLDGILAFSGTPLVQLAAARAAALQPASGDNRDTAPNPAPAEPAPPPRPLPAAPPPDLPMVAAANRITLTPLGNLSPRLRRDSDAIQAMRLLLARTP